MDCSVCSNTSQYCSSCTRVFLTIDHDVADDGCLQHHITVLVVWHHYCVRGRAALCIMAFHAVKWGLSHQVTLFLFIEFSDPSCPVIHYDASNHRPPCRQWWLVTTYSDDWNSLSVTDHDANNGRWPCWQHMKSPPCCGVGMRASNSRPQQPPGDRSPWIRYCVDY